MDPQLASGIMIDHLIAERSGGRAGAAARFAVMFPGLPANTNGNPA
jgi:hypothetical protein